MMRSLLFGTAAFAALTVSIVPLRAGDGILCGKRCPAITSPVDCPEPEPKCFGLWKVDSMPYYSATPVSNRWREKKVTPYYPGYLAPCFHKPPPYGSDGCLVGACGEGVSGHFGSYTGAPRDEAMLKQLGGNGLEPVLHGPDGAACHP